MISKLIDKIVNTKAPIVVGLDPKLSFIPERILRESFDEKGRTPAGAAEAFYRFNREIIDSVCDIVPAVKPQIAMYEELGIEGLITFKKTVDYAKEKGLIAKVMPVVEDMESHKIFFSQALKEQIRRIAKE